MRDERRLLRSKASAYINSQGFPRVGAWFQTCVDRPESLADSLDAELIEEWNRFRYWTREKLAIGRSVDQYIRRCIFVSGRCGSEIKKIEEAYTRSSCEYPEYCQRIRNLILSTQEGFAPEKVQKKDSLSAASLSTISPQSAPPIPTQSAAFAAIIDPSAVRLSSSAKISHGGDRPSAPGTQCFSLVIATAVGIVATTIFFTLGLMNSRVI
jgi:hypothetical protein